MLVVDIGQCEVCRQVVDAFVSNLVIVVFPIYHFVLYFDSWVSSQFIEGNCHLVGVFVVDRWEVASAERWI